MNEQREYFIALLIYPLASSFTLPQTIRLTLAPWTFALLSFPNPSILDKSTNFLLP